GPRLRRTCHRFLQPDGWAGAAGLDAGEGWSM
ncbi:MAG: hypothetical protein AVDCRST_MAG64-595, partial [uncultured Phycisphaerae bacterium]